MIVSLFKYKLTAIFCLEYVYNHLPRFMWSLGDFFYMEVILISQHCKFMLVIFVCLEYNLLIISVRRFACWTCIPLFQETPWGCIPVLKHVGVWYLSWIVFYDLYIIVLYWVHLLVDILNSFEAYQNTLPSDLHFPYI